MGVGRQYTHWEERGAMARGLDKQALLHVTLRRKKGQAGEAVPRGQLKGTVNGIQSYPIPKYQDTKSHSWLPIPLKN